MGGGGEGPGERVNPRYPAGHNVWGKMCHYRGVVTHSLSPFEQRVTAGMISHGIPNVVRRVRSNLFAIGIPLGLGYMLYDATEKYHDKLMRKDPKKYEDEYAQYLVSPEHKAFLEEKAREEAESLGKDKKKK